MHQAIIETNAGAKRLRSSTLNELKEASDELFDNFQDVPFSGHILWRVDSLLDELFDDEATFLEHLRFWQDVGVHLGIPSDTEAPKLRETLGNELHRAAVNILHQPDDYHGDEMMEMFFDPAYEFLEAITLTET